MHNSHRNQDVYINEVTAEAKVLSKRHSVQHVRVSVQVDPDHPDPDYPARADGYWFAFIVKAGKTTAATVTLTLEVEPQSSDNERPDDVRDLTQLQSCWLQLHYVVYGRRPAQRRTQHVILPLQATWSDAVLTRGEPQWRHTAAGADVLPVPTHVLCHVDDPVGVMREYVLPRYQKGDVITIAETPVAIMQGRYRHPSEVRVGLVARLLCYMFGNAASLSSACGLQSLVDVVGPIRVLFAAFLAILARIFLRKKGVFYSLAGEQARLIDDVTGTMPPFDQFIVLGPKNGPQVLKRIQSELGMECAIVDVNDLKRVAVVTATPGVDEKLLMAALMDNPAGNANQQTPLVLIRPNPSS